MQILVSSQVIFHGMSGKICLAILPRLNAILLLLLLLLQLLILKMLNQLLPPPPCLIIGRHPIDRMISYYYERIYKYTDVSLNNLTIDMLQLHINTFRSLFPREQKNVWVVVDDGISENMCRALSDQKNVSGAILPIEYDFGTPELYYAKPLNIHEAS